MKRWLFILGIIIIVILIAVWVFLLFASNETKREIYNRFGFTGTSEEGVLETILDIALPDIEEEFPPLRQLTTRRLAGYAEIIQASSSPQVYITEAGTGHVYSINLQNGSETKISNTTIAGTRDSKIAKSGSFVAIKAGDNESGPLTIVPLNSTSTESITVDEAVLDFTITDSDQLLYSVTTPEGIFGRTFDIETRTARTLFTVPFWYVDIIWSNHSDSEHYILPKTARTLEGYLYTISTDNISRTPISGYGLSALSSENHILYSKITDATYRSYIQNKESSTSVELPFLFFPQKCAISSRQELAFCGRDASMEVSSFPDSWYRGELSTADEIWQIDLGTSETNFLINTLEVSGREIDMTDMELSNDEFNLYFINKNDHTLWVYDILSQVN